MKLQEIFDAIFNDPLEATLWDDVKAQSFTGENTCVTIGNRTEKNTEETVSFNEQKENKQKRKISL